MRTRTTWLLGVLAVWFVDGLATATPALAGPEFGDSSRTENHDGNNYAFVISDAVPGDGPEEFVAVEGEAAEPLYAISYREIDVDPVTGEDCTRTRVILVFDEADRGAAADTARLEEIRYETATAGDYPPPCSGLVVDPGAPAQRAAELVAGELQPAVPYVQPDNRAITGMRSYLDTNLDSSWSEVRTVSLFGRDWEVEVDVAGVHTVDWGDGTVATDVTGDGGPWHEGPPTAGDISHAYIETGTAPVVVTTDWTVTATLLANGQTRQQSVTTTSQPVPIDISEVRSVRQR